MNEWLLYNQRLDGAVTTVAIVAFVVFLVIRKRIDASTVRRGVPVIPVSLPLLPDRPFWVLLMLIAGALRAPLLFSSMWYDETFTARMASLPFDQLMTALQGDVHPFGFYAIEWLIVRIFGESAVALRVPSLGAGLLLIYLVYRLAKRVTGDKATARLASIITAFLPAMLYYSTEARYPAMLACSVLISMIALLENRKGLFTAAIICLGQLHYIGLVFAGVLIVFGFRRIRFDSYWFSASAIPAVMTVLSALVMLRSTGNVSGGFWLMNSAPLWHILDMTITRGAPSLWIAGIFWFLMLLLTVAGGWASRRWLMKHPVIIAVAVAVPVLLWFTGVIWHPVYLARALIAPALLVVIVWAYFLRRSQSRIRWVLGGGLIVGILVSGVYGYTEDRSTVDDLYTTYCRGADYIYTTSTSMAIMAMEYSPIPVINWGGGNNLHQSLTDESRAAMQFDERDLNTIHGDICYIYQLSYYTTEAELTRIHQISLRYLPAKLEEYLDNQFVKYVIVRFTA